MDNAALPQVREYTRLSPRPLPDFSIPSLRSWKEELLDTAQGESVIVGEELTGGSLACLFATLYPHSPELILETKEGAHMLLWENFEPTPKRTINADRTLLMLIDSLRNLQLPIWQVANPKGEETIGLDKYDLRDTATLEKFSSSLTSAHTIILTGNASPLLFLSALLLLWPMCNKLTYKEGDHLILLK